MWRSNRRKTSGTTKRSLNTRGKLAKSKVAMRRSKIRALQVAALLFVATSIFGGLSWASFLDVFAVQAIVVEGNEDIRTRSIQSELLRATENPSLGFFSQQSTLLYKSAELEELLLFTFPKIDSIAIDSQPTQQRVVVSIKERLPYALWCGTECYFIDNDGYVYEETATSSERILFTGHFSDRQNVTLRNLIAPQYFKEVVVFLETIQNNNLTVTKFIFEGDDARITFDTGWDLRIALDKDLPTAAFNFAAVMDEYSLREKVDELLYIDMRFDDRVYYKVEE